jgi:uncharacterized phiE125 gp8 family phage protein
MLIVTTAATVEPVTATEAKQRLRVTHTSDDTLLENLISSAREAVEMNTGRALAAAEYRWVSTEAEGTVLRLPLWPVASVEAVSYENADGDRQTMDAADYTLDGDRAQVRIDEIPDYATNWTVEFTVAPTGIPSSLKDAIILFVGDLYENPEAKLENSAAADRLMFPHRVSLGL